MRPNTVLLIIFGWTFGMLGIAPQLCADEATYLAGVAQVDITPNYPVRLSGFASRKSESEGVTLPIWAKALSISLDSANEPVVLITVDNLGIPASMCDEVAKRLEMKVGLKRSRLAITASHTHSAPMLRGVLPTLFGAPIPDEQIQHIDRYTSELTDLLEQVALQAIKNQQPSRLVWGIGSVKFAINRRTKGGPVDHDLPMLVIKNIDGTIRAIYVNYACHCVTLSANKIDGDWAGYAQDLIQREFPSAIALVSVGSGADQNPSSGVTGDKTDVAMQQGAEIAAEVKRMLGGFLAPVQGHITTEEDVITLAFAEPPTIAEWQKKAEIAGAVGYHARVQLERLARGEALQSKLDYPIASWKFGDSLAMVFLPGEVVVDYSLRLKKELDGQRLWINAYSNDEPCYIPSERVLAEGGYEVDRSMLYYDRPGPFKPGLESQIIKAVHQQLDTKFAATFDANKTSGTMPKSPQQSWALLQTTPNLRVDLVVAEPFVADPVAIDFGLDGSLWVADMQDYPNTTLSSVAGAPGEGNVNKVVSGCIRLIRDLDGDGQFDCSTIFLDNIHLPTGVTVWRSGVLVCTAPDILYAEDTDGDDKADVVKKLYTGFGTSNNQARVNSLVYGIDGWIHGSCGLFGGKITNFKGETYELGDRDFKIKPDTGEIEAVTGRTQQGRVRDDFGNWFGCDNSNLGFHYPLAEKYLKRNPNITSPSSRVNLLQSDEARRLYPARADAQRFQLSGAPGTVTAACGIGIYRDSILGEEYTNNLFVCEPVNLLVHRMILKPSGTTFSADRPANENRTEFLRSTDGWFRPVQATTGPDGSLWVVDMYRFIIEDPRWIPKDDLAPLDPRAGTSLGRIYRVRNAAVQTPPATRLGSINRHLGSEKEKPVAQSASPQGRGEGKSGASMFNSPVYRELEIQRLADRTALINRSNPDHEKSLRGSFEKLSDSNSRMRYYRELEAGGWVVADDIVNAIKDQHPGIRAYGLTLAEKYLPKNEYPTAVANAAGDEDGHVRLQVACSLGQWDDPGVGTVLAGMAFKDAKDLQIVAAIFSSVTVGNLHEFTKTLFGQLSGGKPPASLMMPFLATAVGYFDNPSIKLALESIAAKDDEQPKAWQLYVVANLVESLSQKSKSKIVDADVQAVIRRFEDAARTMAFAESLDDETRMAAIHLMGRDQKRIQIDTARLAQLLSSSYSPAVQGATVDALERIASDDVPSLLSVHFRELSPDVQPRVIDALLSRNAWLNRFFSEIKQGAIPLSAINTAQRQELVTHPIPSVREQATTLLAATFNSDRQQVIRQYQEVLTLKGDVERGRLVFSRTCSQCHRLGDVGHSIGPNLLMVANKTPSFLLQELLDPNRNVDSRYTSYVAVTKGGLIRTGILSSESSTSVTLLAAEGKQFKLLRQDLDEFRSIGKSLMPEGLEKDLSPQAIADVISFLASMPAPPKKFEGNTPAIVKPISDRLELLASTASIYGDEIVFERPLRNIGYWHGLKDHVAWTVELPNASEFDVYLDYACDPGAAGNLFIFETGAKSISGTVESTGGWGNYAISKLGTVSLAAGSYRIVLRPDGQAIRGALLDLRGVYLIPAGESFTGKTANVVPMEEIEKIARQILDDNLPVKARETLIAEYPASASNLTLAMTVDMPDDPVEEYRRIPWIWRVAVACGKRDQVEQIRSLLSVSLPKSGQTLKDWQAVVIGGGIINGISLKGEWPRSRIDEILQGQPDLKQRWQQMLAMSVRMTDDDMTPTGTRYDAMRIIALGGGKPSRDQLAKYLAKGIHEELQMGAISGLSDIDSHGVPELLLTNLNHFNQSNRILAIDAMLRTDSRSEALLDGLSTGQIQASVLNSTQRKLLRESTKATIRDRALKLLDE